MPLKPAGPENEETKKHGGETDERQSQRLAFLGALAGGLAHEIRNPLSTLNVNLQLLQEELVEAVTPREKMAYQKVLILLKETNRLEEILNDFLKFAGRHLLKPEPTDLNALIEEILVFIAPSAAKQNIKILRYYDRSLPSLSLDPKLMKQALLNIIINAQQAMEEKGGELILKTSRQAELVIVEIIDTGTGMPPEVQEKIFNVYFSAKRTGTGLGLPTARRIIEEHNGFLSFQSEVNKGSCFTIKLPL